MPRASPQTAEPVRHGAGFDIQHSTQRLHNTDRIQPTLSGDGRGLIRPSLQEAQRVDDAFSKTGFGQQAAGSLPGGGQCSSGARRADGGAVGPAGGRHSDGTPRFDQAVGPGAYLWWYVDAISDDGQYALSIIAFVGSVFSPYYAYAFAKQGSQVDAQNHCAINVALYGPRSRRWSMTERGRASVERDQERFVIGPSQMVWKGDHLQIDLNEVCVPIPQRVRGTVRVFPTALCTYSNALDDQRKHRWGPIAPCARVEVDLQKPELKWQGNAYLDSNEGDEPVTVPFKTWDWSRARMSDGSTAVIYDVTQTNGVQTVLAELFKPDGSSESFTPAAQREPLAASLWRVDRGVRSDGSGNGGKMSGISAPRTKILDTLEDTPFYTRSLLQTTLLGERVIAVHETIEPQRLRNLGVRMMLPWRMPRRA